MTSDSTARLRRFLIAILLLGMSGSGAELLLLGHHEDLYQIVPLALIAAAIPALAGLSWAASRTTVLTVRLMMSLFILAGVGGVALHFRSNLEFQQELDPSLRGAKLLLKVLQAKAPPALAPGVMVQLGLLGLVLTHRHPALGVSHRGSGPGLDPSGSPGR